MTRRWHYTSGSEFGASVSSALTEANLTQTDLARLAKKSPSYINQVINGTKHPSGKWVNLVADILNLQDRQRLELHHAAARDSGFDVLDLTKK